VTFRPGPGQLHDPTLPQFSSRLREAIERHVAGPQNDHPAGAELEELLRRPPKPLSCQRRPAVQDPQ
jgi:hypothetical protein